MVAGNVGGSFAAGSLSGIAGPVTVQSNSDAASLLGPECPLEAACGAIRQAQRFPVPLPGGPGRLSPNGTVFQMSVSDATGQAVHSFAAPFQLFVKPNAADLAMASGDFSALTFAYLVDEATPPAYNPNHYPVGTWVTVRPQDVAQDPTTGVMTITLNHLSVLTVITNPIGWVQTVVANTPVLSSFAGDAQTFGTRGQFAYLQVTEPQVGDSLVVLNPTTNNDAYVKARDVGPSGPPPW